MARIQNFNDEPDILELYRMLLKRPGYALITATDRFQALDLQSKHSHGQVQTSQA